MISGILNIAKIEAGKAVLSEQVVSLPEIVDTAVTAVRAQAALKRLDFQAEIPERLPYLMADPTQLVQIAINLLSNAVKFTPEGGEIRLEVYRDSGGEIVLSVADTGIGMSPEEVMSALQPFVQIDNSLTKSYAGTGLGLPLATKLAELHGGSADDRERKGIGHHGAGPAPRKADRENPGRPRTGGVRFEVLVGFVPAGRRAGLDDQRYRELAVRRAGLFHDLLGQRGGRLDLVLRHLEQQFVVHLEQHAGRSGRSSAAGRRAIARLMMSAAVPCKGALIAWRSAPPRRAGLASRMPGIKHLRPNSVST